MLQCAVTGWRPVTSGIPKGLACHHPGADLGAQLVDQLEALAGLDVPEGPAVAGARTLGNGTDAVDRANPLFRRSRINLVALEADIAAAEAFCHGARGAGAVEGVDHEIAGL